MMRVLAFMLLVGCSCIAAIFSEAAYSYMPFVLLVVLGCWNILSIWWNKQQLIHCTVQEMANKRVVLQLEMTRRHRWKTFGTYKIAYRHTLTQQVTVVEGSLTLNEKQQTIELPLTVPYCGQIQLQTCELVFADMLQLYRTTRIVELPPAVTVWPVLKTVEAFTAAGQAFQQEGLHGGAHERLVPYTQGDALHSIHWPLSAKTQQLIVAKPAYAPEKKSSIALYFNEVITPQQYDDFMSSSYSYFMQEAYEDVWIWQQGWTLQSLRSRQDVQQLFRQLLSQPLQTLYAHELPPTTAILRYTGRELT